MLFKIWCSESDKIVEISREKTVEDLKTEISNRFGERLNKKVFKFKTGASSGAKVDEKYKLGSIPSNFKDLHAELVEGNPMYNLYIEVEPKVEKKCCIL